MKFAAVVLVLFLYGFTPTKQALAQSSATTVTAPAAAPTTPPKKETPAEKAVQQKADIPKVAKKIVVTGSYIRRAADEGAPSPVSTIDNTKAQEAGTYSAGGMMADNAVISSGTDSNVEFHGQSSANNLVLLNGLRLPKSGGNDSASIDFIPASAIERVEILKDGASALYGSEALAGVVNIITKKEYDGANITLRHTRPERFLDNPSGSETNFVGTYGKTLKNGNILGVIQYRGNKPVWNNQTEYGIQDVNLRGSEISNPGNLIKTNNPKANYHAADCPPNLVNSADNLCRYDYTDRSRFLNEANNFNALLSSGFDLPNGMRLETGLLYRRSESIVETSPVFYRFSNQTANGGENLSIPGVSAAPWGNFLVQPGGGNPTIGPGDSYSLAYSPDQELGLRRTEATNDSGVAQLVLGKESDDIDWNISVGYSASSSEDIMVSGNARRDLVYQKLTGVLPGNTPTGPGVWNPFLPANAKDPNILNDAKIQTWNKDFADVLNTRFIVSGKEIDWGPKSVYAAFGLEHQLQSYKFTVDDFSLADNTLTGSGSNQKGSRNVFSTFLELTQNPIPKLQLQLAGRFDAYSDFGTTINPKIAAAYQFNDKVMMRSSFGTGFKAPDLRSLYQGQLSRQRRIRDEVNCRIDPNSPNCSTVVQTTNGGDPNLEAELGQHLNIGLQLRPTKKVQINIDHWRAQGTESITEISSALLGRLTAAEADGNIAKINDLGVTIQRDSSGAIEFINYPLKTNSGKYKVNGIDIDMRYKTQINPYNLGSMNLSLRFDHSHTLRRESQAFFFLTPQQNFDLDWKNVSSVSLSKNNHLMSWRIRTFAGGDKDRNQAATSVGIGSIPTISEHDLHYEYYGAWDGVITFGIRNVFDKLYYNEYSTGQNGFLYAASPTSLGRSFYLGYSQDF